MKILVTGGAGFIASHLCDLLLTQGHDIVAIDDLSTGRLENIASFRSRPNFHFVRETISNAEVLDRLTSESDVVIHLAAAVGVKLIVENPVHTIETNVLGTEMVLNAALIREESRGLHERSDFPEADPKWLKHTIIKKVDDEMSFSFEPVTFPYVKTM